MRKVKPVDSSEDSSRLSDATGGRPIGISGLRTKSYSAVGRLQPTNSTGDFQAGLGEHQGSYKDQPGFTRVLRRALNPKGGFQVPSQDSGCTPVHDAVRTF